MTRHQRTALLCLVAAAPLAAACGKNASGEGAERRLQETGYRGVTLEPAVPRPDFTLTDTKGDPFSFRDRTEGGVTLLYFGYTNCPDVCPAQMANLAAALHRLPFGVQKRVQVVFVTTDPARDTARALRAWLDGFDPSFVGLTGPRARTDSIEVELGLPPASQQKAVPGTGAYAVGHAAQVIAFTPDDSAHLVYPFGTRQLDWTHDLPKLTRVGWSPRGGGRPSGGTREAASAAGAPGR